MLAFLLLAAGHARAGILAVGPGERFALPGTAARYARDGDVIEIDAAGVYVDDHAVWRANGITIRGVGGRPHIRSTGTIANGKAIWVVRGNDVRISNVELSGARVRSRNGAAIRLEGRNFRLSDCFIHDNENGILGGIRDPDSEVVIERCEFAFNGRGDRGRTHNIYIGRVGRLVLRDSYSHDAFVGHLVKSRAQETLILYNRLFEGPASYAVDIPDGGRALIMGNILHQGRASDNGALVSYAQEGLAHEQNALRVVYNSFLSTRNRGVFIRGPEGVDILVANNLFSGRGTLLERRGGRRQTGAGAGLPGAGPGGSPTGRPAGARMGPNLHEQDLFAQFSPTGVRPRQRWLARLVDQADPVRGFDGEALVPRHQFRGGGIEARGMLGTRFDLGAIEYR